VTPNNIKYIHENTETNWMTDTSISPASSSAAANYAADKSIGIVCNHQDRTVYLETYYNKGFNLNSFYIPRVFEYDKEEVAVYVKLRGSAYT
jgi:hypothetical protein